MIRPTLTVALLALALTGCAHKSGPPYSVQEAAKQFRIEAGYRIEPFVAEPDVVSPVAMEFDEDGRIFVVEDRGYPLDVKDKLGRIKLLEDTNGDGVPDRATIFADHLVMPTGVMRWKKGILVTDAPDLIYLEDTDGDGKADVRKTVLTGFAFTNPQHTVNGPVYGLDNGIYRAHENAANAVIFKEEFGDRGSDIRMPDHPDVPALKERNRNVRFRPDAGQLEALSSSSQFGHAFDDWGHHFTVTNSNHSRYEAIAAAYIKRNPDLPLANSVEDISDHGAAAKVFPIVAHPRFEMLSGVGGFTSACSTTLWRGSLFVAEPAHSILHRDVLQESGATFVTHRAQDGVEFLASTDSWFRPVGMTVGPDGALYLMDFYRLVIEHPEWMSTQFHHSKDLTLGIDRGRIYRIVPDSGAGTLKGIHLSSASNQELVNQLENPNIWWRRTAQRLLMDRKATDAVPALVRLARDGKAAVGRVHALWTLDGLGQLEPALIEKALADPEAGVRENAIRLAETRLQDRGLSAALLKLVNDTNAKVRYQLLETLGFVKTPQAQAARDQLLIQNADDKWFQVAALSAGSDEAPRLYARITAEPGSPSEARTSLFRYTAAVIGARQKASELQSVLQRVASAKDAWWRTPTLEGLAMGMRGKHAPPSPASQQLLLKLFESPEPALRRASLRLLERMGMPEDASGAIHRASERVRDANTDPELRADSIGLLALAQPTANAQLFQSLIDPHQPEPVQEAAVKAYGSIKGDEVARYLLSKWRGMTQPVRYDAADAMYSDPARVRLLLAALQKGDVQPWTLAFRHKSRLVMNNDPQIREAARPILDQPPEDRQAVVKQYQVALDKSADPGRGEQVFRNICSKCHKLNGYGAAVGPDLTTVRNQPKQVLLTDILIPSQSIAQGYEAYVVETLNGGTLDGVIGAQTPTTITLKHEEGKEDIIQRQNIKNMYATNLSAMPGDLEKQIGVQQMADLLEYLKRQ